MVTRPRNLEQADPYFDSVVLLAPFSGEDADTSSTDLSNSGHTLTFAGTAALDSDIRKFGFTSLLLDGDSDYISLASNTDFNFDGDFTMEAWLRLNAQDNNFSCIFGSNQTSFTTGACFFNAYGTSAPNNQRKVTFGDHTQSTFLYSTTLLSTDVWYHVAISRTGSTIKLFVDGVEEDSASNSATFAFNTNGSRIGSNGWDGANGYVDGWIENLRITKGVGRYTGTFTPPERAYPTVGGQNPVIDGLIINLDPSSPASYPGSGTTIYDLSPNNNDGTLVGSPTISGGIIQMDGIDDSISFTSIDISHTDKVSMDFWCKLNTYVETDGTVDSVVFEMSPNYNSSTVGFTTTTADDSVGGYNDTFPVSVNLKGNIGYNAHGYNKTLVNDLAWHHWCCIFDKSVSGTNPIEGRLYIDGIEQSVSQFPTTTVRQNNTNNFGNVAFYIGSRANTVANIDADWGSIRLYDRVLTDGEVRQNFEAHRNRYGV